MAAQTLTAGTRRRVLFGLLDAESWSWASLKAFFWFIVIIFMLGYIPDRAYYFTVFPTIDLGLLAWSPVNLCPASNETLPCPAPEGAVLPWQPSPSQVALPQPRTDGAAVVAGTKLIYIGGSQTAGGAATTTTYVANLYPDGNFSSWTEGPALPSAVKNESAAFLGGSVYVFGGTDASGQPTKTAYVLTIDPATGQLGQWQSAADAKLPIDLPAPRTAAAIAVASDGLVIVGGDGGSGPVADVWKSTIDKGGKLTAWAPQASLFRPQSHAIASIIGSYIWVYAGQDANGPVGAVQRGDIAPASDPHPGSIVRWGIKNGPPNLPVARTGATGFMANDALYLVGGSDGKTPRGEVFWATPNIAGEIAGWEHVPASDFPAMGLAGSSAVVDGSQAFLIGGTTSGGVTGSSARGNLAPQPPFFQLGLVGATVPALKLSGEIGQQLGYLNAAGAGTVDFVILILIGYAFAHRDQTRAFFARFRRRG